jgi:hypothetical protein
MQIIGICGKKQSGKTTLSNFMHGHEMKLHDVVQDFSIDQHGNLVVNYVQFDDKGKPDEGTAVFDLWQRSDEFIHYAQRNIWPLIKGYNFADAIKDICINLFGLSYEQVYGLDSNKNSLTDIMWENMPGVELPNKKGPMTARELMQHFGTDIMRKIRNDVWIENCMSRINYDQSPIAVISDCRYINEVEAVKKAGGVVIYLTRFDSASSHSSENDLNDYKEFDAVIDNKDMSISQLCDQFLNIIVDMGITKKIRSLNPRRGTTSVK